MGKSWQRASDKLKFLKLLFKCTLEACSPFTALKLFWWLVLWQHLAWALYVVLPLICPPCICFCQVIPGSHTPLLLVEGLSSVCVSSLCERVICVRETTVNVFVLNSIVSGSWVGSVEIRSRRSAVDDPYPLVLSGIGLASGSSTLLLEKKNVTSEKRCAPAWHTHETLLGGRHSARFTVHAHHCSPSTSCGYDVGLTIGIKWSSVDM